jgi:hypothetical protein
VKTWERWTFGLLVLVVSATGVAYFWMKYLMTTADPFALVNHAWQGAMLSLHVLASPALLLVFGVILNSHIMKKLGATRVQNRTSGLVSFGSFFLMTASGYGLQVATGELMLQILVALHVTSGALFSVVYLVHLIISARLSRAQATRRMQPEAA